MKINKCIVVLVLFTIMLTTSTTAMSEIGIEKDLRGYLVGTYENAEILESHGLEEVRAIASLSKLMTYYVLMDAVKNGEVSLDDEIILKPDFKGKIGSTMGLEANDHLFLEKLIEGILIPSANDACIVIDEHLCGSELEFVKRMNETAQKLNLETAKFYNSTGLTENGNFNKMSMKDLFELTRQLIKNHPEILKYSQMKEMHFKDRTYINTNPLIGKEQNIVGLKTGATPEAGSCLVTLKSIPETKDYLIFITMGSFDKYKREENIKKLLTWMDINYTISQISTMKKPLDIDVNEFGFSNNIAFYSNNELISYEINGKPCGLRYEIDSELFNDRNVQFGTKIGKVSMIKENTKIIESSIKIGFAPKVSASYCWIYKKIKLSLEPFRA